jgi:hypothetical protein
MLSFVSPGLLSVPCGANDQRSIVEVLAILMEIMPLDSRQTLLEKPVGSGMLTVLELDSIASRPVFTAITPDQLVALSLGGFAFLYIPSQQLHYQIPRIIQLLLTHSNDLLMPAPLVFAGRYG